MGRNIIKFIVKTKIIYNKFQKELENLFYYCINFIICNIDNKKGMI